MQINNAHFMNICCKRAKIAYFCRVSDKELMHIVSEFTSGILNGKSSQSMCFAVCYPLEGYLGAIGIETTIIEGTIDEFQHFWLQLPDGRIIDPTADQFNHLNLFPEMPPIYFGKKPEWYMAAAEKMKV